MSYEINGGGAGTPGNSTYSIDGGTAQQSPGSSSFIQITAGEVVLQTLDVIGNAAPTGTTVYEAINYTSSMIARRLLARASDLLSTREMEISVDSTTTLYDLNPDFLALKERPFLVDGNQDYGELEQLTRHRAYWKDKLYQKPKEYDLVGGQIELYPAFTDSDTLVFRYYAQPALVAAPDDIIPFKGMFDHVYFKAVPRVVVKGLSVIQSDGDFEVFLDRELDAVLNARVTILPQRRMRRSHFM